MKTGGMLRKRQVRAYALGTSAIALGMVLAGPAFAQCAPDPTVADQTTQCDGEQAGGLVVASESTTVAISPGAVLSSSATSALLVARQSGDSGTYNTTTVVTDGAIRGSGQYGVEFRTGIGYSDTLELTVGASGSITGTTGIVMTGSPANPYGYTSLELDNSGTISGTEGYAIRIAPDVRSNIRIENQESGVIGAIMGAVSGNNKGVIDGSLNSAIYDNMSSYGSSATFENSGTITSNSVTATITGIRTLINSGIISNTGTGAAIEGSSVDLTNQAGGNILSGSDGIAIRASRSLQLSNSGTINGDVLIEAPVNDYAPGSTVDSTNGKIDGNLTFGAGQDRLHAVFKNGALFTGVTGTVNGGAGNDGIILDISEDTSIASRIAVAGFEYLRIATSDETETTLEDGFSWAGPLRFTGSGSVVNRTDLVANGYLGLQMGDSYAYSFEFSNVGTITGNAGGNGAAISLYGMTFDIPV